MSKLNITVLSSNPGVGIGHQGLIPTLQDITVLPQDIPDVTEVDLNHLSGNLYRYTVTLAGGRVWRQELTFDNANNPSMTFDVTPGWRLSEFTRLRSLLTTMVAVVTALSLTRVRAVWLD